MGQLKRTPQPFDFDGGFNSSELDPAQLDFCAENLFRQIFSESDAEPSTPTADQISSEEAIAPQQLSSFANRALSLMTGNIEEVEEVEVSVIDPDDLYYEDKQDSISFVSSLAPEVETVEEEVEAAEVEIEPIDAIPVDETSYWYDEEDDHESDQPLEDDENLEDGQELGEVQDEDEDLEQELSTIEVEDSSELPENIVDLSAVTELPAPTQHRDELAPANNQLFQASSGDNNRATDKLVDQLFDRMSCMFSERDNAVATTAKAGMEQLAQANHKMLLSETKHEVTNIVRTEMPKLMATEIRSLIKAEIVNIVKGEVVSAVRGEFEQLKPLIEKMLKQINSLEPRLAVIEGAVDKEVAINFPKGGFHVEVPVNVPEREVKVAAPININPPSVVFDKDAVNVHLHKDGDKNKKNKKVTFNRDGYDRIIDAEIVGQ